MKKRMTVITPDGAKRDYYPILAVLGEALKQARIERGLTQSDLAALMNTSQTEISRIESGTIAYSITKIIDFSIALEGATVQIESKPSFPPRNVTRTESHFVVLQDYAGYNQHRSESGAIITTSKKNGYTEEEIEWFGDFDA